METSTEPPKTAVGPLGIFWDMESCPIPKGVKFEDVAANIRSALSLHPLIGSNITSFSTYGTRKCFPISLRRVYRQNGIKIVDFPSACREAGYKGMLFDIFLFAVDHPMPSSIVVISKRTDLTQVLLALGQSGYTVLLMVSLKDTISSMFQKAGHFLWDWPTVACMSNGADGLCLKGDNKVQTVKPGDLDGLKKRMVMLLKAMGGSLLTGKFSIEYTKMYGQNLYCSDYGGKKLAKLLTRMSDVATVTGKGADRMIVLRQEEDKKCFVSCSSTAHISGPTVEDKEKDEQCPQLEVSEDLKEQVVKLMQEAGGSLPVKRFPLEYAKMYGLSCLAKYGTEKLVTTLDTIEDVVTEVEDGKSEMIVLKKEKEEEEVILSLGGAVSNNSKTVVEEDIGFVKPGDLEGFKKQMVKLLKEAGGSLFVSNLRRYYSILYGHGLPLEGHEAVTVGELLEKISDVVAIARSMKGDMIILKEFEEGTSPFAKRKRLQ